MYYLSTAFTLHRRSFRLEDRIVAGLCINCTAFSLPHVMQDLSGRPYLGYDLQIPTERIGNFDTQMVEHFFQSMANTSGMTLHIRQLAGRNSHHIVEATFKAFARSLRMASETDPRRAGAAVSSKGVLTQE